MLLLPSGKAYAFGCNNFDKFDDFDLDLDRWTVQNNGSCYEYEIENRKLKVTSTGGPCANRIFFMPNTSKQVKSISAEVTVLEATECHRARLLADPVMMRNNESGFHQLALMEPIWDPCNYRRHCPHPGLARFIMNPYPDGPSLFDGIFHREAFFGPESDPWPPEQIIGKYLQAISKSEWK